MPTTVSLVVPNQSGRPQTSGSCQGKKDHLFLKLIAADLSNLQIREGLNQVVSPPVVPLVLPIAVVTGCPTKERFRNLVFESKVTQDKEARLQGNYVGRPWTRGQIVSQPNSTDDEGKKTKPRRESRFLLAFEQDQGPAKRCASLQKGLG